VSEIESETVSDEELSFAGGMALVSIPPVFFLDGLFTSRHLASPPSSFRFLSLVRDWQGAGRSVTISAAGGDHRFLGNVPRSFFRVGSSAAG
jgi:hypothetical protein